MDTDSINKDIGRRIRNHRNRNGLTQQELADRTELTKGFISQLERGPGFGFGGDTYGPHRVSGHDAGGVLQG